MLTFLIKALMSKIPKDVTSAEYIISGGKGGEEATLCFTQEDMSGSIYLQTRDLFKEALQSRKLSREQLIYFKQELNSLLGDNKKYYYNKYKNDAHEIYTKLKSPFLGNQDYELLNRIILRFTRNH